MNSSLHGCGSGAIERLIPPCPGHRIRIQAFTSGPVSAAVVGTIPGAGGPTPPDPEDGATGGLLVKPNGNIVIDLGDVYGTAPRSSKYLRLKADRLLVYHCYQQVARAVCC